jgi:alpha-aminoadipate carrier protein LysW
MVYYSPHMIGALSGRATKNAPEEEFDMASVKCPVCDADVKMTDVIMGELVTCPDCGVELEVTSLSPLTVEEAPEVQEDWGE